MILDAVVELTSAEGKVLTVNTPVTCSELVSGEKITFTIPVEALTESFMLEGYHVFVNGKCISSKVFVFPHKWLINGYTNLTITHTVTVL